MVSAATCAGSPSTAIRSADHAPVARGHHGRLHPDVAWEDACRAYAFAAASHAGHAGTLDLDTELQLEDHWDRLRGDGGPEWPVARTLLRETWRWLDEHGHDHDRIAQAVRH